VEVGVLLQREGVFKFLGMPIGSRPGELGAWRPVLYVNVRIVEGGIVFSCEWLVAIHGRVWAHA
jgi:hypothetical protein